MLFRSQNLYCRVAFQGKMKVPRPGDDNTSFNHFHDIQTFLPYPHIEYVDDSDASSDSSFSTTATCDDNIGVGRVIDKYVFQPAGRKVERLLMRMTIGFLHPCRISSYIEARYRSTSLMGHSDSLSGAVARIYNIGWADGSTVVAGLKGLVRQVQYVFIIPVSTMHK